MIKNVLSVLSLLLGLVLEMFALAPLWSSATQNQVLYSFLIEHLISSMLLAGGIWLLLPTKYSYPRVPMLLLLFNVAFFMPVLGICGVFAAVVLASFRRRKKITYPFASLILPEFVLSLREPDVKFSQGEIKSRLRNVTIPTAQRLQSLLSLQGIPARVSSPLLQDMLGDAADDIRLVAYGLLDSREKKITAQIHRELINLKDAAAQDTQLIAYKQLAELYWELVYAGLALGDLRLHALNQAMSYADATLALAERDTGMLFLKARILNELKKYEEAQRIFTLAMECGFPELRALPYLIEIAFNRGNYDAVQSLLGQFPDTQITPMMQQVVNFWLRRENTAAQPASKEFAL